MAKNVAGSLPKTSWLARGLPPAVAAEVERRDRRLKRRARWAAIVLLPVLGIGSALYFSAHHSRNASIVTTAIAAGERGFTGIAAVVTAPVMPTRSVEPAGIATAPGPQPTSQPAATSERPAPQEPQAPTVVAATATQRPAAEVTAAASAPLPTALVEPPAPATTPQLPLVAAPSIAPAVPVPAPSAVAALPPVQAAAEAEPAEVSPAPPPSTLSVIPPVAAAPPPPVPAPSSCVEQVASAARQTVIWFAVGSAEISVVQAALISRFASELVRCSGPMLEIGGHTDVVGVDNNNFALSWRRAEAVRAQLEASGIAPGRMVPIGYGTREPMVATKNATVKDINQLNRRVEFKLR